MPHVAQQQNVSPFRTQTALGRLRSHSLDSGAPLMPPSLISSDLLSGEACSEDNEDIYGSPVHDSDDRKSPGNRKSFSKRESYHCRRYDGNIEIRVRAQVMLRDDSTGGWVPMGCGGLANVSVKKRKVHHREYDQPCRHEYLIQGKRTADNSVVLNCSIKKDFVYNKVMPTFHHWKAGNKKFGLTFQTAADAKAFHRGVRAAIQDLSDAKSLACPHKHYRDHKRKEPPELQRQTYLEGDDDDVFMQLVLPVMGCEPRSRSPSLSDDYMSVKNVESRFTESLTHVTGHGYASSHVRNLDFDEVRSFEQSKTVVSLVDNPVGHFCIDKVEEVVAKDEKEFPYVKFFRCDLPHENCLQKFIDRDEKVASASSSFKKHHIQIRKSNSGGSVRGSSGGKASLVVSGSSLGSSSINDSSISGSVEGKRSGQHHHQHQQQQQQQQQQLLPTINAAAVIGHNKKCFSPTDDNQKLEISCAALGPGSPAKTSLVGVSMPLVSLTCTHCGETFSLDENRICSQAPPDCWLTAIETSTCFVCAKCLLHHCIADGGGGGLHPCSCSNLDGHRLRRWIGLTLLSILMPCLCCYIPILACYKCGSNYCNLCGGRHQPQ